VQGEVIYSYSKGSTIADSYIRAVDSKILVVGGHLYREQLVEDGCLLDDDGGNSRYV
jgi:hypothetical protein